MCDPRYLNLRHTLEDESQFSRHYKLLVKQLDKGASTLGWIT